MTDAASSERRAREALDALVAAQPPGPVASALAAMSVRWVDETGSTNADLLQRARQGAPSGEVLVADHQHAGRGRLGRSWSAPPGASLLVSTLLRPELAPEFAYLGAVALALCAADACEEVTGLHPAIKWPNDLVVETADGTRKLGGVLSESLVERGALDAIVVGVGLNANWPADLPEELAPIATSIAHELGVHDEPAVDRVALLVTMLANLADQVSALSAAHGRAALLDTLRARCTTLGRQVRAELSGGAVVGRATDISGEGHLVIEGTADGESGAVARRHVIAAGDVIHLRPAPGGGR